MIIFVFSWKNSSRNHWKFPGVTHGRRWKNRWRESWLNLWENCLKISQEIGRYQLEGFLEYISEEIYRNNTEDPETVI